MNTQVCGEYLFTLHKETENDQLRYLWLATDDEPPEADVGKHHHKDHFEDMLTAGLFVTACIAILVISVALALSWGLG